MVNRQCDDIHAHPRHLEFYSDNYYISTKIQWKGKVITVVRCLNYGFKFTQLVISCDEKVQYFLHIAVQTKELSSPQSYLVDFDFSPHQESLWDEEK